MLITKPQGRAFPKPDLFAANVQRQGHHKAHGDIAFENDARVLVAQPTSPDEHDRNLGLAAPCESKQDRQFHAAAELLEGLVGWLGASGTVHSCGLRGLALAWCLRPAIFEEKTVWALSKRFGVTRQAIIKYTSEIHRLSHGLFTTGNMQAPIERQRRRTIAIAAHRRAGHALHAKE